MSFVGRATKDFRIWAYRCLSRLNIHISAKHPQRFWGVSPCICQFFVKKYSCQKNDKESETRKQNKTTFAGCNLSLDLNMRFPRSPCTFRRHIYENQYSPLALSNLLSPRRNSHILLNFFAAGWGKALFIRRFENNSEM